MVGAAAVLAAGRPRPGGRTLLAAFTPFTAASPRPGHVPGRNRTRSTSRSLSPRCCPTFSGRPHDSCPTPSGQGTGAPRSPPCQTPARRRPAPRGEEGAARAHRHPIGARRAGRGHPRQPQRLGRRAAQRVRGSPGDRPDQASSPSGEDRRQPGSHEAPRRSTRAAPRGLRARASWLPTLEQGVTMTTSARAWPFAMTRVMRTDYRLVAAPDFLLHSGQAAGLNAAANGNIDPDCVHLRPCSGPEGLEAVVRIPCGAAAHGGRRQTGRHGTRRVRPSHPAHRRHRMPAASRRSAGARPNGRSTPSKASAPRPLDSTEGLASSTAR